MTDEEVIQAVDNYIDKRIYRYAIMIDGSWGCGKTYFIERKLIPHLQCNDQQVNYISLFGMKSTEEIANILCLQAMKDIMPKKARKILDTKPGKIGTTVVSTLAGMAGQAYGLSDISLSKFLQALPDFDNNIIIFDDLERCGCDISLVLGFLNNFVEHSEARVIVIANEEEIGKWQLDNNPELQMMLALDKRLHVKVEDPNLSIFDQGFNDDETQKEPDNMSLEKLFLRRNAIFNSNVKYVRMKEKVIGRTIRYEPDLKAVFEQLIIDNIRPALLRRTLTIRVEKMVEYALKEKHRNIRTFQFFLEKISAVFELIGESYPVLRYHLIDYAFRVSVRHVKGMPMPNWGDAEYGKKPFDEDWFANDVIIGFKFIDDFIRKDILEKGKVQDVLTSCERYVIEEGRHADDPYNYINKWYYSEDEDVQRWMDELIRNIKNDVYSTSLYPDIVHQMSSMQEYGVMVGKTKAVIDAMEEHLRDMPPENVKPFDRERFIPNSGTRKKYGLNLERLTILLEEKLNISEKKEFERIITEGNEHWPDALESIMIQGKRVKGRSFIYWLEPETIIERLKLSNNSDLDLFRRLLNSIYNNYYYYEHKMEDYPHINKLSELLAQIDLTGFGEIKQFEFNLLKENVEEIVSKLAPMIGHQFGQSHVADKP